MRRWLSVAFLLVSLTAPADEHPIEQGMRLDAYLVLVGRSNLELASQKLAVPIAEAQIAVARVFPEPVLSGGLAAVDISGKGAPTAWDIGLSQTIEIGGKRGARVDVATQQKAGAQADLDDFFRNLRANATNDFIDALHNRMVVERKSQTLTNLERLVKVNDERLRAGDIGQVALIQSRVEAQRFHGEVLAAQGDAEVARLALGLRIGSPAEKQVEPIGDLRIPTRSFELQALLEQAHKLRPDLRSKGAALEAAKARLDLAHANRWEDLTLSGGFLRTLPGTGAFTQPAYNSLSAGLSIPLPLARIYRGELDAAQAGVSQAEYSLRQAQLVVETDVRQALARYDASVQRVQVYRGGILADADKVAEATLYSYQHGSATLLEVLDSQRTVNEVYLAYFDALSDYAKALVAVETTSGLWDVRFEGQSSP
jgi:cobalt-zinc-cadmium efflux system outer membrane protein